MQIFDRNSKNGGNKSKHPTQKRAGKEHKLRLVALNESDIYSSRKPPYKDTGPLSDLWKKMN